MSLIFEFSSLELKFVICWGCGRLLVAEAGTGILRIQGGGMIDSLWAPKVQGSVSADNV